MMAVIEAILACIGLLGLVVLMMALLSDNEPPPPPVEDAATPYREGLHAAVRMQRVAQDLEQQIYETAAQHMAAPPANTQAKQRP